MIKAVIFDAEGVIIDTHPIWVKGDIEFIRTKYLGQDFQEIYDSSIVTKITGRSLADGVRVMQEILNFPGDPEELATERIIIMEKLFKEDVKFVKGFEQFFNEKVKGKYKTGVGTAIRKEFLDLIEQKLSVRNFFGNDIFHIHDVGNKSKPNPDIFLHAAEKLSIPPSECLVIEDAPNGIEAAKRAGMKVVGITTTFKADKLQGADQIVDSFDQINLNLL